MKESPRAFFRRLQHELYQIDSHLPFYLDHEAQVAIGRVSSVLHWLVEYTGNPEQMRADHCRALFVTAALQPGPQPSDPTGGFIAFRHIDKPTYRQMLTLCTPEAVARMTDRVEKRWWELGPYGPEEKREVTRRTCTGQTKAGKPCRTTALFLQPVCWRHGGDREQAQRDLQRVGAEQVAAILERIADPAERLAAAAAIQEPVDPVRLKGVFKKMPKWWLDKRKKAAREALKLAPAEVQLAVAASRAA